MGDFCWLIGTRSHNRQAPAESIVVDSCSLCKQFGLYGTPLWSVDGGDFVTSARQLCFQ